MGMLLTVKNKACKNLKDKGRPHYKELFYISFAFFVLIFIFSLFFTKGTIEKTVLFSDSSDTFMDHFNSVIYNEIDPYENKVIYPPLASLLYKLCNIIIPADDYNYLVSDPTSKAQPRAVRIGQSFQFQFILFTLFIFIVFLISFSLLKKGKNREKMLFMGLLFFSAPFLFVAERGNNILLPVAFSIFFVVFYDSKNKVLREFALISLAISVGLKLYPLVFALLLFTDKKYWAILRFAIYCIITTILPFFIFYNGFESLMLMLTNILGFDTKRSSGANINTQLDFKRTFYFLYGGLRKFSGITISEGMLSVYSNIFKYLLTFSCAFAALLSKTKWKQLLFLSAIICGYPGACSTYILLFLIIPTCMFLDNEKRKSFANYYYLIMMLLSFIPTVISPSGEISRYWSTKWSSFAVMFIAIGALCELIGGFFTWNAFRKQRGQKLFPGMCEEIKNYFVEMFGKKPEVISLFDNKEV